MGGYYVSSGAKLFDQVFYRRPGGAGRSGKDISSWRGALNKAEGLLSNTDFLDQVIGRLKSRGNLYGLEGWNTESGQFGRGEDAVFGVEQRDRPTAEAQAQPSFQGSGIHYGATSADTARAQAFFQQLVTAAEARMAQQDRISSGLGGDLDEKIAGRTKFLQDLVQTKQADMASRHTRGLT